MKEACQEKGLRDLLVKAIASPSRFYSACRPGRFCRKLCSRLVTGGERARTVMARLVLDVPQRGWVIAEAEMVSNSERTERTDPHENPNSKGGGR